MKIFIQVTSQMDGNRVLISLDNLDRVEEEKDKNASAIVHNGERIAVKESYDYIMECMGRALKETNNEH